MAISYISHSEINAKSEIIRDGSALLVMFHELNPHHTLDRSSGAKVLGRPKEAARRQTLKLTLTV